MLAEFLFIHFTGAMQSEPQPGMTARQVATIHAKNGAVQTVAILLGGVISMISTFGSGMFQKARTSLGSLALMPIPMIAGLALGLGLSPVHLAALASLIVVLALGGYLRRFGPAGFLGGQLLFMGTFIGFILSRLLTISVLGWLACILFIGAAMAILAQFTLFYPSRRSALQRLRRSLDGRIGQVMAAALDFIDDPDDRRKQETVHRLLVRLNETALMTDAQLGDPAALPRGATAAALHQRIFDGELAASNTARFAVRIASFDLPQLPVGLVRTCLQAIEDQQPERAIDAATQLRQWVDAEFSDSHDSAGHQPEPDIDDQSWALASDRPRQPDGGIQGRTQRIVMHRFASSVLDMAEVLRSARDEASPHGIPDEEPFDPAVELRGGYLPGSSQVSATASTERGTQLLDRSRMPTYSRVAIQMTVAVTAAIVFGSLLSPQRFYWAVIATFVTFLGAFNAAEQLRKLAHRIIGTIIGVFLGAILVHIIGTRTLWSIVAILVSVFIGIYMIRISYAVMVTAITIMVSQLYVRLHEFSNELLLLRLAETALGAVCASLTVLFVIPLRTRRVVRVAVREQLQALRELITQAMDRLYSDAGYENLRPAARQVDATFQALDAVTAPSRNALPGLSSTGLREQFGYTMSAARHYARNLVVDTEGSHRLPAEFDDQLSVAHNQLVTSLEELTYALDIGKNQDQYQYWRSAALLDQLSVQLNDGDVTTPRQLTLRDLQLLDGALATLARSIGMQVHGLDTPTRAQASSRAVE
jgi:uncharacterized membrane protein YgaE (UPF0421/DUF939 family)